jgi:hypothetical protein
MISRSLENIQATRIVRCAPLSTVIGADLICVLEDGRLVEEGKYDELMAKTVLFARAGPQADGIESGPLPRKNGRVLCFFGMPDALRPRMPVLFGYTRNGSGSQYLESKRCSISMSCRWNSLSFSYEPPNTS